MKATFKSTPIPAPPPIEEVTITMSKKDAQMLRRLLCYIRTVPRYQVATTGDVGILLAGLNTLPLGAGSARFPTIDQGLSLISSIAQELAKLKELE